jgi:circadian clock protein KaiB
MSDPPPGREIDLAVPTTDSQQMEASVSENWSFSLYIAGPSPKSTRAAANLRQLCETHVPGRYTIEVVDLVQDPSIARTEDIFAVPTLIRRSPQPMCRVIGDLADADDMVGDLLGFEPTPMG